jgi:hypothetical protein
MRATDPEIRKRVIDGYLQGVGRNENARLNGVGETTVTDIIHGWLRNIESQNQSVDEYEAVRELAVHCKARKISVKDFVGRLRLNNFITRLGPDVQESQIEELIATVGTSSDPQHIIKVAIDIAQVSDLSLEELQERITTKQAEKDALQAEILQLQKQIEEGRRILDAINMDKKATEEYREVKAEMNRCSIIPSDSPRFLNVIRTFRRYGYASAIMNAFIEVQDVKRLKQETDSKGRALDARMEEVKETLPWARQMLELGVSFEEFFVFINIIREYAEEQGMKPNETCYRAIEDLRNLKQYGGIRRVFQQSQQTLAVMDAFTATKQRAIMTLMFLENAGLSADEIVSLSQLVGSQFQNRNNGGQQHASYPSDIVSSKQIYVDLPYPLFLCLNF